MRRAAASLFAVVKAGETVVKRAKAAEESKADGAAGRGDPGDDTVPRLSPVDARFLLSALDKMDSVFGIFYDPPSFEGGDTIGEAGTGDLPEAMTELLKRRLAARESKDWATADAVRDEIRDLGYAVKVRLFLLHAEGGVNGPVVLLTRSVPRSPGILIPYLILYKNEISYQTSLGPNFVWVFCSLCKISFYP